MPDVLFGRVKEFFESMDTSAAPSLSMDRIKAEIVDPINARIASLRSLPITNVDDNIDPGNEDHFYEAPEATTVILPPMVSPPPAGNSNTVNKPVCIFHVR